MMQLRREEWGTIEAELCVPAATVRVVHTRLPDAVDRISFAEHAYRFGLCLVPGPHGARAGYPDRWGPHRFARLGNAFVLPPGEHIRFRSDCGRDTSLTCEISAESMHAWSDAELEWSERGLEACLDVRSAKVRSLLLRLAEEARHPGFASRVLVEAIAVQLAVELHRYCRNQRDRRDAGGLAPWRLRRIDERLREVREAPTLAELAGLCGLSTRQLTRAFRAARGCSIGDHVARVRIEHATRLLATDHSIKAIAYALGFSSPSGFAFAFRRATGETPREFRQHLSR
jgi:AraC family transcriptional regulator